MLRISIRNPHTGGTAECDALVDTGFAGTLVLGRSQISVLGFTASGSTPCELADGSSIELETYTCLIDWFGEWRQVEALARSGGAVLVGTELLADLRLIIDYPAGSVTLERPAPSLASPP